MRIFICFAIVAVMSGCKAESAIKRSDLQLVTFKGMCDASGAVPLSEKLFAIADDEDNALRIYDAYVGGDPLAVYDLSASLGLYPRLRKDPEKPPKAPPELDIEGATIYKGLAYWITSHGRNSSGKLKPERLNFFATNLGDEKRPIEVVGQVYENLIADLAADPRMKKFRLLEASEKAPKEPGGLNIEGLTARQEGGVWIGFRNPLPDNKAIVVALLNPEEVIKGASPRFTDPQLLDLDGRSIRALSWWRGHYLIAAGPASGEGSSLLYLWNGARKLKPLTMPVGETFNPEAFFTPESKDRIMVFNDQGAQEIDGIACKKQKDPSKKYFTGVWFTF